VILSFGFLGGLLEFGGSLLSMWALDEFIYKDRLDGFPVLIVLALLAHCMVGLFTFIECRAAGRMEGNSSSDVRKAAFTKLQTLSYAYYDKMPVGYLLSRLTNDISRTMEVISWSCIDLGWGVTAILASMAGMFLVNWKLALITILTLPLLAVISVFFN
jgi:ATP-binding cassette subfamily B protein